MKLVINKTFLVLIVLSAIGNSQPQAASPLPSVGDVIANMVKFDAVRQSEMTGYMAVRHYTAVTNKRKAEMLVRIVCASDGTKQFSVLTEEGSGAIRKHVLHKLLKEEEEASHRGTREDTRLIPANYEFRLIGKESLDSGPAYVLEVSPKTSNKYLINGKIWVDARDYSIVRIEGQPARNPSFWVHGVHFVHTYQKIGQFWFASSTHTTSEVRIFGTAELTIDNSGYALNPPRDRASERAREARLYQ
jgi:hypothetical protein